MTALYLMTNGSPLHFSTWVRALVSSTHVLSARESRVVVVPTVVSKNIGAGASIEL